jgi:hypothetical protein
MVPSRTIVERVLKHAAANSSFTVAELVEAMYLNFISTSSMTAKVRLLYPFNYNGPFI